MLSLLFGNLLLDGAVDELEDARRVAARERDRGEQALDSVVKSAAKREDCRISAAHIAFAIRYR